MNKKRTSPGDRDILAWIKKDPDFAESYFEEYLDKPLSVQLSLLRRLYGYSQTDLARKLHVEQPHISKLERQGRDHRVSLFERVSRTLGARLILLPPGGSIVFTHKRKTPMAA